jgi:Fic family protein
MARYIWADPAWPAFHWDAETVTPALGQAARLQGEVLGAVRHLTDEGRRRLQLDALTADAVETSRIEGELLDPASVRRSIARRLDRSDGPVPSDHDVEAISSLTVATLDASPLTRGRLLAWHLLLFDDGGVFRNDEIAAISGAAGAQRVHFEAPPPDRLEASIDAFVSWANADTTPDPFIASAIAHFWLVTIHPFPDGNGRISRAAADNVLARTSPEAVRFVSMTRYISQHRAEYYTILERTQRGSLDITAWILWFLEGYASAAEATLRIIDEADAALAVWTRLARTGLSKRQADVIGRLLDGFRGKLTTAKYAKLAKVSEDTALRDLTELVEKNVLIRQGAGKTTSWTLAKGERLGTD